MHIIHFVPVQAKSQPPLQSISINNEGLGLGLDGKSSFAQEMRLISRTSRQSGGIEGNGATLRIFVAALRAAGIFPVNGQRSEGDLLFAAHRVRAVLPIGQKIDVSFACLLQLVVLDSEEICRSG